jgi:putative endonuclease
MSRDDDPPATPPPRKPVRAVPTSVGPTELRGTRNLKRPGEIGAPAETPTPVPTEAPVPTRLPQASAGRTPARPAKPPAPERKAAQKLGLSAESRAAAFLMAKGYRIIARRYKTPVGEIDIVAQRLGTVVFVEVKARASLDAAAESISPRQRSRIIDAARYWLAAHPKAEGLALRFDAVLIAPGSLPRHLPGAFDASA